jgi:glucuronate isomerase
MATDPLEQQVLEALNETPILDAHTHLVGGRLGARGLHDILLYHMAVSELYAAGCPSGARLTQYPGWPDTAEAHRRIGEALPHLDRVRNTSISWGVRMILKDLYGWTDAVTADNWRELDALIRERSDDRAWHREIVQRAGINRICTEISRREQGQDDDLFNYSLEWAFFTRCQWGEYDTALYELERCWGRTPATATPIGGGTRPAPDRVIHTLADVHAAIAWYVDQIPIDDIISTATHFSTDIDYQLVSDGEMALALASRSTAGIGERDLYASYIHEAFLTALEKRHGGRLLFQFSFGAEPLPFETDSRLAQRTIGQLAGMVGRHPKLRFQCYLSSAHANQSLCTLCRELPNLSLAGYWWHNFFPSVMARVMNERLDMLPLNRQVGFFSDAYCVEWTYAKAAMVRRVLAKVLTDKIHMGQYDYDTALSIAREMLYETPRTLCGMVPMK